MKSVRFLRLSYFVWLIIPAVLVMGYQHYGIPHLRWSYSWIDQGQGYDPYAERHYTRCTYISVNSQFTVHPVHGHCALFVLRKPHGINRSIQP